MRTWLQSKNYSTRTSSVFAPLWPASSSARFVIAFLILALLACEEGETGRDASVPAMDAARADGEAIPPDTGPPGCTGDAECDDGIDCTADTCTTSTGTCRHQVVPALCPAGSSCHPVRGCEMGRPCATNVDCADDDACTTNERCDPAARTCVVDPLDGDRDGDPPRVCGGGDCDDSRASVYAGAPEFCDGIDNDCDGRIDEGLETPVCGYCQGRASCEPGYTAPACYADVTRVLDFLECTNRGEIDTAVGECADAGCSEQPACMRTALAMCSCPPPRTFCPGDGTGVGLGCMDLMTSPWDCGACGNACGAGMDCVAGSCQCPAGQTLCGGTCVDTTSDATHCGGCGNACPADATCADAACRCPAGQTLCSGACVDLSTDSANCGSCGRSCSWPLTCVGGSCACPSGTTFCEGRSGGCVDLASDEYNCGSCENPCAGQCVGGVCNTCDGAGDPCCVTSGWHYCRSSEFTCSDGFAGGVCVACGGAGEPCCDLGGGVSYGCDPDLVCGADGRCACPPTTPDPCGSACVDLLSDLANCGACGNACPVGASCSAGACVCPGADGRDCRGVCVDLDDDPANCGACGVACGASEACVGGSCRAVFETTVTANRLSMFRKEGTTWSTVRSAISADSYFDSTAGSQVFSYYSGFWGRYFNHRVGVRFARPSLPPGATVVGASLTMRPSDVQQPSVIDALYVTSFAPTSPDRSYASDYSMSRWGDGSTSSYISAYALMPETATTVGVPYDAVMSFTSTSSYWFVGIRTAPDVSGSTPLSTDPAAPATPRVAFDELADLVLIVRYVL